MASLSPECMELKEKYDTCFNKWYSDKFLKGLEAESCDDVFKLYKACIWRAIREKNIDKLISDARKDSPFKEGSQS
ncbi:mitochondrial distribution/morphology family 35/apoptosis [Polychytrium aggregatum]|uniref:mitochondrial distribution/morphology family 35/apoptosis n=1 Tax=Polychytrium aggregatum TaxID=110093 RepID=UPI0022FEBF92|nr:mitochondrial distribution/morphology family 35/apoptosis [Polychytrium aggregatum]KAI9193324.1 mitochondrial distribution/morphology family 35/apoptosis [Polychytrium aggregatum]